MRSKRLYHIVATFLRYGLDELIPSGKLPWYAKVLRPCFFWLSNKHKDKSKAQRFRLAIESLGPVFIKFGQMLSTRRDILPTDYANELALLQDKVQPFSGELAQQIVIDAIGEAAFNDNFTDFDQQSLASASIAQVHTAKLKLNDGELQNVVLKVLRPNIKQTILADLDVMLMFATLVKQWLPDGKRLRPTEVVAEYRKTILDELDLMREAANAIQLRRNFDGDNVLHVPEVYSTYCHANVMVMERIYGISVAEVEAMKAQGVDMKLLAERGVEVFFTQVFRDSFFHADMHPGNVFVDTTNPADPTWIAIDCGIVGTLNREDKRYLAENFVAFFNRDYRKVAELHVDSGWVPADTKVEDFEFAIRTVCEPIFEKPLAEISFGQVLVSLFNTARRFNMEVQPQLVLLQKTLLYIEGLGRHLYPQLDLWQTAKPFLEDWVKQQMGFTALFGKVKDNLPFWGEKLPEIPDMVYDYLKTGRESAYNQQRLLEQMQVQQKKQHRQLQASILAASLLVAAALMWLAEQPLVTGFIAAVAVIVLFLSKRD